MLTKLEKREMKTKRPNRYGYRVSYTRKKHEPSGVIIVWQDADKRIHTRSIAIQYPLWGKERSKKMTILHANTELLLQQLETMGVEGYVLPAPMMTVGLSRLESKRAYIKEIEAPTRLALTQEVIC